MKIVTSQPWNPPSFKMTGTTKTMVVVSVSVNGYQSRPSLKKCILGCWKSIVPCLFQDTTAKNKVMTIAATLPGVEKVSLEADKNLLTVIGEEIDTVKLVNILRDKVGFAKIVSQGPEPVEKKEEKPPPIDKEKPTISNNTNRCLTYGDLSHAYPNGGYTYYNIINYNDVHK
ncbi:hypothetical protein HAX54_022255 [Datura stramonium]|uniref:HMA domain-containing protein n=1 Tax=Datura stramonium TaxID=4076 RepID=A0ABS8UWD4_DATST|nr:hypothetical protein [Datura stramonium]